MRKNSWFKLVSVLLLVFSLILSGCGQKAKTETVTKAPGEAARTSPEQKEITLKYASKNPPTNFMSVIDIATFKKLESDTAGKVKVTPFWAETLANSAEWYNEITKGTADMMNILPGTGEERFPVYAASTNFFFDVLNMSDLRKASDELWAKKPEIMAEWKKSNVVPLSSMSPGSAWLHSAKPVRSIAEFKGMTIRVSDNTTEQLVKSLGANPVRMTMGEAYSALQKGIISGILTGYDATMSFKLGDVAKYSTEMPYTQSWVINKVMSLKYWNDLAPDTQKSFEKAFDQWEADFIAKRVIIDQQTATYIKDNKIELIKLPLADQQKVTSILEANVKLVAEKANSVELYNAAREIAKKYKK